MTKNVNSAKAAYAQPKLAIYGGFTQLTASGSLGTMEGTGVGNNGPDRML